MHVKFNNLLSVSRKSLLFLCSTVGSVVVVFLLTGVSHAATTTVSVSLATPTDVTSRYTIPGLPPSTACTYQFGYGTVLGVGAGGASGLCNTNDFLVGDNSVRVQPNFDNPVLTGLTYTGRINVGTNVYVIDFFEWTGSTYTAQESFDCDGLETQILNLEPTNGTTTSNNVDFLLEMCVNQEDVSGVKLLSVKLHNIDQNVLLLSLLSPSDIELLDTTVDTPGYYSYATSSVIGDGNYRIEACYKNSYLYSWISNPFSQTCTSNQFVVNQGTYIGSMTQSMWSDLNTSFSSTSATSTQALANMCNLLGGNFSISGCLLFMFIPDQTEITRSLTYFKDLVSTHFPIGYITDTVNIFTDTATTSMTVIDATLPTALGFGSQHLYLSLNNVLDPILNATVGIYANESATDTRTLFEITNEYWVKIVYILTLLYILGRILGSDIIPTRNHFGKQGALSDISSSDDSYRLKEYLYNHRNKT